MLRQQQAEEMNGSRSVSPRGDTTRTRKSISRAAAEDVLETAAMLQSAEQDGLSVAEIEALAAKRGLTSRHVRQALAMHGYQSAEPARLSRIHLSRRDTYFAIGTPLLYGLMTLVVSLSYVSADSLERGRMVVLLYTLLPIVLGFVSGMYFRYKRVGALVGAGLPLSFWLLLWISFLAMSGGSPFAPGETLMLALVLVASALAGTGGAAVRQWFAAGQLPHQSTVLRASDLDR